MDSPQQIYGVQELYRPADGNAEVDIVAVHGLNGNAMMTWTARPENICWLNHPDFLPKYIQNARVLAWGYNANVSSTTGPTSSNRILQHAQTLVHQLEADRDLEDADARPIIFLCHSLGGIIVKRAIAYSASRKAPALAHIQSIYTSTYAILFFGTPHHGSSKARLLGSLQKVVRLAIPSAVANFENSLVDALKEQSETLQNINDQFAPLMAEFRIYFFWEQEKTDLKYTNDYIVEESSAAPILDNTERCGIAADHRGMCKFSNNRLQSFRTAISALRRYARDAPDVTRVRHARALKALQENQVYQAADNLRGIQPAKSWLEALNTIDAPAVSDTETSSRIGS
ncbi:hypothetical protein GX50_07562 [[Emmonsia] crescens]|uniref:DUF676 domain-containing protein n=1 Tax=[Emmonsia] crescens TaxID=73230 RepID=A0A2B7ZA22_9EURO|nr:hypothetical protein GX50_07562 [Emmonsia crescens]